MTRLSRTAQAISPSHSVMAVTQRLASVVPMSDLIHDMIAHRAYVKWKARGCRSDTALQDWLEAEAEVKMKVETEKVLGRFVLAPLFTFSPNEYGPPHN